MQNSRRPYYLETDESERLLDVFRALPAVDTKALVPLAQKALQIREIHERFDACGSLAEREVAIASDWLHSRHPYEREISIDITAESRQRDLFGRGERLHVTTRITIS